VFVLFVRDLPWAIRCGSINIYADDTTLYTAAKTIEETTDTLTTDAQSTLDWYKQSWLIVNLRNTHFMVLGRKHRLVKQNWYSTMQNFRKLSLTLESP